MLHRVREHETVLEAWHALGADPDQSSPGTFIIQEVV
jgi:hypothetical protein